MHWVKLLLVTFFALICVATAGGWFFLTRSLPSYDQDLTVEGLSGRVEIYRTPEAVPHIFGESDVEVYFGLGYAHAQDRFWQMEMLRRSAEGRLSELLGPATLHTDELLRRLDLYGAAVASLEDQNAYTNAALDAYAAGINARITEVGGSRGLAPEFLMFPIDVEPWAPEDSIAIMKILALQLASHIDREVLRARVAATVPADRLADILPDDPNPGMAEMPGFIPVDPSASANIGPIEQAPLHPIAITTTELASNAWTAGSERTVSGVPLLGNDTHLNFTAPTVWYLTRLELETGGVIGGTIPGIPTILSGRTDQLAWGLTAANMDDQDVFLEKLNPNDPSEVLTPGGYQPLRTATATIDVRGSDSIVIDLMWSENGPIIPPTYYNFDQITPPGHVTAIARTLLDPNDTSMSAAHKLLQAGSVGEAISAMEGFVTPAQNLSLIDRENIALQMIGKMPMRIVGHSTLGRTPSEGWLDANRWHGFLPYTDNPRIINPAEGVIGNTNSKTVDRPFPRHVSWDWGDTQRIQRWKEAIAEHELHSRDSFAALQFDMVSFPAEQLLPRLFDRLGPLEGRDGEALTMLAKWEYRMDEARPEPLIFAAWMRHLQAQLANDELGESIATEFLYVNPIFLERVLDDVKGAAIWCDDIQTAETESCDTILRKSLSATLDQLTDRHGASMTKWRWGDVHIATHDHLVFRDIPVINRFVNIQQPTSGHDNTLLRGLTHGKGDEPLRNLHGALYRAIVDLSDPDMSVFVISTGQSGHFMSSHYRDMGRLWRVGDYVQMSMDGKSLYTQTIGVTRLLPQ